MGGALPLLSRPLHWSYYQLAMRTATQNNLYRTALVPHLMDLLLLTLKRE